MIRYFRQAGVLRLILQAVDLAFIAAAPFSGGEIVYSGWKIVSTLVLPAIVPILFFGTLLDVLMNWVFRMDSEDAAKRKRHLSNLLVDLAVLVGLLAAWLPHFLSLGK
jgi:hypothetical protein